MTDAQRRDAQHSERHDLDDVAELQHEGRHDDEDAAAIVTRREVASLIRSVQGLEGAIHALGGRMDRQWREQGRKRRRLAVWLVIYTLMVSYAAFTAIDQHVKTCMSFGSVPDAQVQRLCNLTVPFHHHPLGGISDDVMEDVIERAERVRDGR